MRIVLIPGLLGTRMRHRKTGRVTWGSVASMYKRPAWGLRGDDFHLPLGGGENPNEPDGVLEKVRVIPRLWEHDIYGRLIRALESRGHTVMRFDYDWRKSHAEAAGRLPEADAAIAHSTGGFVLDCALRGGVKIPRAIWAGYPARGTFESFKDLNRSFNFAWGAAHFRPSVAFAYPAAYEALPRWPAVLDGAGQPVADQWDAKVWARERWGVFAERERRTVQKLYGVDEVDLLRHLMRLLDDARRFHDRLGKGPPPGRHYVLMNDAIPTLRAALGPRLRFTKKFNAPGDGNTVAESVRREGAEVRCVRVHHRYLLSKRESIEAVQEWLR